MRANSVRELTRNSVDDPNTDRKSPPGVSTDGLSMTKGAGANPDSDFVSAFCVVLQARFRVNEVMKVKAEIEMSGRPLLERLRPDERGANLEIFCEGFEVYRGCWAHPVRNYFEQLMGYPLEWFETALTLLGEELWGSAPNPGPIVSMITPECFDNER